MLIEAGGPLRQGWRRRRRMEIAEMKVEGRCYCGAGRYVTGRAPNFFMAMPESGFSYVKGQPKAFTRTDLERAVTREFCPECGTHLATRPPGFPAVIVKVGTLDDPSQYTGPDMAIFTMDKQSFHQIADGLPSFERFPS